MRGSSATVDVHQSRLENKCATSFNMNDALSSVAITVKSNLGRVVPEIDLV